MADPNNINPTQEYRTAIAERGKFWPVDQDYLTSLGYPTTGTSETGKYAVLTFQVNPSPMSLSGDLQVQIDSESEIGSTASTTVMQLGAIAESTIPTPVADGETVAQWHDVYGRQIIFGANLTENAIDVIQINQATLQRLGPITNLNAVTATGAAISVDVSNYHNFTIHIISSAITSGGTVKVEHSLNGTNWATISTVAITANGVNEVSISNQAYRYLRTNLTARTDGTYTTLVYAGN